MTSTASEPGFAGQPGPENPDCSFTFRSPFGDLSKATVMTVDDEPIMTDLIEAYLEEAGYAKIISVNQSERALEVLRREQPSLPSLDSPTSCW